MSINTGNSNRNTGSSAKMEPKRLLTQVWTRWEHGSKPVRVYETEDSGKAYEYDGKFFESARKLLKQIHGRSYHHTFEQYFKVDTEVEAEVKPARSSVFTLFGRKGGSRSTKVGSKLADSETETRVSVKDAGFGDSKLDIRFQKRGSKQEDRLVQGLVESFEQNFEVIAKGQAGQATKGRAKAKGIARRDDGLGVDLINRGHEVRKLLFAGFRGMMAAKGYDPEDVLQEIYKGLLTRNAGKCPWDGKKSTFGYYVTMVCRCVLTNYHRKMSRRLDREHVELDEGYFGGGSLAGGSAELAHEALTGWLRREEHGGGSVEGRLAVDVMPLLAAGCTRKEIVRSLGVSENAVAKATAHLRKWSREWADEIGVVVKKK